MALRADDAARDWSLDMASRELVRHGTRKRLAEKPFRVLAALLAREGEVVTREELQKLLWSDETFVDFDNNLNSAVASLRQALGDSAKAPQFIETIPKVGYRLARPASTVPSRPTARRTLLTAPALAAAAALLLAVSGGLVWNARHGGEEPPPQVRSLMERGQYLRGQYLMTRGTAGAQEQAPLTAALAAFQEASRLAPMFADAAAEEAETLVDMSFSGVLPFRDGLSQAREAAARAIDLSPSNGVAARVMGVTTLCLDWDARASRRWLDHARAMLPDARTSLAEAMWLAATGSADSAVDAARRAVALDPAAYFVRADLAMFLLAAGRNTEAAAVSHDVLSVAPDFPAAISYALLAHERLGQWADAAAQARALMVRGGASDDDLSAFDASESRQAVLVWRQWDLARLQERAGDQKTDPSLGLALRHALLGDRAAALGALQQALIDRNALLIFVRSYPELVPLHGDPGFEAIARSVVNQG